MSRSDSLNSAPATSAAPRTTLVLALLAVYLLWGSTYLAIKYAVETLPPFLMAGARFLGAGSILFAVVHLRGGPMPTLRQWKPALVCGALMMMISNGLVSWSGKRVDSSFSALVIASVPLWMMLLDWLRPGGMRPRAVTVIGVLVGVSGVVLLVWPHDASGTRNLGAERRIDPLGLAALIVATLAWAGGSIYGRTADLPRSPLLATAMQMLCGGALQLVLGTLVGEWSDLQPAAVTARSVLSLVYLLVAGSLVGFTAYVWLLRNTSSATASSYAFVNPLVAVLLGFLFANESVTVRTLVAASIIVAGVVLVVVFKGSSSNAIAAAEATETADVAHAAASRPETP